MFFLRYYSPLCASRSSLRSTQSIRTITTFRLPPRDPVPELRPITGHSSEFSFTPNQDVETLSQEQRFVLDLALNGQSLFFTGSAGTGKSFLLRQIIRSLRDVFEDEEVSVTASTGLASLNIGGETLHSFAGVGLGNQHASLLIAKSLHRKNIARWRKTKVLIIDEISMVEARWFDVLSEIGKVIRGDRRPFGGMQVIVSGDFFQLPPVPEQSYVDAGLPVRFAFQARDWDRAVPNKIRLTKVFRQHQPELIQMLEGMRTGKLTQKSEDLLHRLCRTLEYPDGINPVEIYPLRLLADSANLRQMEELPGNSIVYRAEDSFGWDIRKKPITPERGRLLLERRAMDTVALKVGAQVMCIKNIPGVRIVNGSLGKIIDFLTPKEARNSPHFIETTPSCDPEWDPYVYDVWKFYTAGGIVKDPEVGSKPTGGVDEMYLKRDPKFPWPCIVTEGRKWPLVRFDNGVTLLVTPTYFTHENVLGRTEACRTQVPLILAWALTVHKAQGQTLSRVKVDLAGTFAPGQAYVGISRCTSLEGLEVLNFSPTVVFAHPQVVEWDRSLVVVSSQANEQRMGIVRA